jgi:hypothetical protein
MRLPRWLLISLIAVSAVALVAVPAWWWTVIPRRTGQEFLDAFDTQDVDRANELLTNATCKIEWRSGTPSRYVQFTLESGHKLNMVNDSKLVPVKRDLRDLILGQQRITAKAGAAYTVAFSPDGRLLSRGPNPVVTFYATRKGVRSDSRESTARP